MFSRLNESYKLLLVFLAVVVVLLFVRLDHIFPHVPEEGVEAVGARNPLDGCLYVYLDMGTNVGVQIRSGVPI